MCFLQQGSRGRSSRVRCRRQMQCYRTDLHFGLNKRLLHWEVIPVWIGPGVVMPFVGVEDLGVVEVVPPIMLMHLKRFSLLLILFQVVSENGGAGYLAWVVL
jgi:hypothetical protein